MDDTNDGVTSLSFFPTDGESCEKCSSRSNVQKFDGSLLCERCRNEWARMK